MKNSLVLALCLATLLSAECFAGAFSVSPVRLYFEPRDRAVAVTLVNEGDAEIALQADISTWMQDAAGVDTLELTEDLIVAPPSLKLAPHSKQVVRLALLVPRDLSRQMTYRLVVREVPEVMTAKESGIQLPIALVLNMPVFVTPKGARYEMQCALTPGMAGATGVTCANSGSAYAQVRSIELSRNGKTLARFEGGLYILPGAKKTLQLKPEDGALVTPGAAELTVTGDDRKPQSFGISVP